MARNSLKNINRLIKAVQEELPPEQNFIEDLKRSIEMTSVKNHVRGSNYYKPSSMGCIRNMYYTRIGAKETDVGSTYTSWGICNSGTDTHVRVQQAVEQMKDNGIDCEYVDVEQFVKERKLKHLKIQSKQGMETKLLHKTLNLSFLCDGVIRYKQHYYILELKTESANKWFKRCGVDTSHYKQATAYSLSLELPEVLFIYINRDIFDMKAFLFIPTDAMKQELVGLIEECDSYVSKLVPPPVSEDVSKKACDYCSYREQCRKDR